MIDDMNPQRIKAIREKLGESATEFGVRMQVSAAAICYWESGKRKPRKEAITLLEEAETLAFGKRKARA